MFKMFAYLHWAIFLSCSLPNDENCYKLAFTRVGLSTKFNVLQIKGCSEVLMNIDYAYPKTSFIGLRVDRNHFNEIIKSWQVDSINSKEGLEWERKLKKYWVKKIQFTKSINAQVFANMEEVPSWWITDLTKFPLRYVGSRPIQDGQFKSFCSIIIFSNGEDIYLIIDEFP